jgi:hypothetical protein
VIQQSTGLFTWPVPIGQAAGDYTINVRVADDGSPILSASKSVTIAVLAQCSLSAEQWQVNIEGTNGQPGSVEFGGCTAKLSEGESFQVSMSHNFVVPSVGSAISIAFSNLDFDTTDTNGVNDAFEIAVVDLAGNSLVKPFEIQRDALFNSTEDQVNKVADGIQFENQTVTIGLGGIAAGLHAKVIIRLVNNDDDSGTSVEINSFEISASSLNAILPNGASSQAAAARLA